MRRQASGAASDICSTWILPLIKFSLPMEAAQTGGQPFCLCGNPCSSMYGNHDLSPKLILSTTPGGAKPLVIGVDQQYGERL